MFDKSLFVKAYEIGFRFSDNYNSVGESDYDFEEDGIKFIFSLSFLNREKKDYESIKNYVKFSYDEFMKMSIDEIFDIFREEERKLKEIYDKVRKNK